ncbi:MAG: O-antigen ligase family protein [Patescibacteria group bacterium]|nr:O-antigen ligase family protein [Patescibacteria group bacterium]
MYHSLSLRIGAGDVRSHIESLTLFLFFVFLPLGTKKTLAVLVYPFGSKAFFLYAFDIALVILFGCWVLRKGWCHRTHDIPHKMLSLFVGAVVLSFLLAGRFHLISWYALIRLFEGMFCYYYLASHPTLTREYAFRALLAGAFFEMWIGIAQFKLQHNIGLHALGETWFGDGISGTATFHFGVDKIVRIPGTFLHPNILGAFLFMSSCMALYFFVHSEKPWAARGWVVFYYGVNFLLLCTLSRSNIVTTLIVTGGYLGSLYAHHRMKVITIAVVWILILGTLWGMFGNILDARFVHSFDEFSYTNRVLYNEVGLSVIASHPILGVGIGNFVDFAFSHTLFQAHGLDLPYLYQPVHNLYIFIAAETGVTGFLLFLAFLGTLIASEWRAVWHEPSRRVVLFIFVGFLALAMIDHYFWDLEQGIVMFWMVLGFLVLKETPQKSLHRPRS